MKYILPLLVLVPIAAAAVGNFPHATKFFARVRQA